MFSCCSLNTFFTLIIDAEVTWLSIGDMKTASKEHVAVPSQEINCVWSNQYPQPGMLRAMNEEPVGFAMGLSMLVGSAIRGRLFRSRRDAE